MLSNYLYMESYLINLAIYFHNYNYDTFVHNFQVNSKLKMYTMHDMLGYTNYENYTGAHLHEHTKVHIIILPLI